MDTDLSETRARCGLRPGDVVVKDYEESDGVVRCVRTRIMTADEADREAAGGDVG